MGHFRSRLSVVSCPARACKLREPREAGIDELLGKVDASSIRKLVRSWIELERARQLLIEEELLR